MLANEHESFSCSRLRQDLHTIDGRYHNRGEVKKTDFTEISESMIGNEENEENYAPGGGVEEQGETFYKPVKIGIGG